MEQLPDIGGVQLGVMPLKNLHVLRPSDPRSRSQDLIYDKLVTKSLSEKRGLELHRSFAYQTTLRIREPGSHSWINS